MSNREKGDKMESRGSIIQKIAEQKLGLETLKTRGSDSLDFSDQPVWLIREALEAAYVAGIRSHLPGLGLW